MEEIQNTNVSTRVHECILVYAVLPLLGAECLQLTGLSLPFKVGGWGPGKGLIFLQ